MARGYGFDEVIKLTAQVQSGTRPTLDVDIEWAKASGKQEMKKITGNTYVLGQP